ncbi:hypothetical protein HW561_22315 [Rhodobacteraceae bacterium B1Z28]|uniref:DDE family transposase n=1 Tax=Ruegeria haliotis TaxID=2747601 RepID=A0ABX2PY04_9RHOB|nr:hypothetical protein [Ruegeria haliotis]
MDNQEGGRGLLIGRTKGGKNAELHAMCDSQCHPLNLFVTADQVSDHIKARALLSGVPNLEWLLGGCGYDADWLQEALKDRVVSFCIPGCKQRKATIKYDKRRNRTEIMFGGLKD